jgi:hypothetical protein
VFIHLFSSKSSKSIFGSRIVSGNEGLVDDTPFEKDLPKWKLLYHKLQNLEDHLDVLPHARDVLLSFLREGLLIEKYKASQRTILHIETYDKDALSDFLRAEAQDTFEEWERYTQRRAAGYPPELFQDREGAREWLKDYTPLNLIDGAWLCRIHKITTPFALRSITRHAWQTLSEELGSGDLEKNHIFIYRELLRVVGVQLPASHDASFILEKHGMKNPQIWKAALAQLLISLFPNDFLPEILGFNLHFERLSHQTLKAAKELPEFGISGLYYSLHISIDNGHSGHSAMAVAIVNQYIDYVSKTDPESLQETWSRIQSGYLLSQSLDGKETMQTFEYMVASMLSDKAQLSRQIHCGSRVRIDKQSLTDWLASHNKHNDAESKTKFLNALANARPWIVKGDSDRSRLIRELSWKGKMFGAFTNSEVRLVRTWIDSLVPEDVLNDVRYWQMVGHRRISGEPSQDIAVDHPVCSSIAVPDYRIRQEGSFVPQAPIDASKLHIQALLPLWFAHVSILENVVNSPFHTIDQLTSYIVKILHAEMGYKLDPAGVAGMDEQLGDSGLDLVAIGVQMMLHHGLSEPECLKDVLSSAAVEYSNAIEFSLSIFGWSMGPIRNEAFLVGLARAFLDLEVAVLSRSDLLPSKSRLALGQIVAQKQHYFTLCLERLQMNRYQFGRTLVGYNMARERLRMSLV